jgi:hypothetical protein
MMQFMDILTFGSDAKGHCFRFEYYLPNPERPCRQPMFLQTDRHQSPSDSILCESLAQYDTCFNGRFRMTRIILSALHLKTNDAASALKGIIRA